MRGCQSACGRVDAPRSSRRSSPNQTDKRTNAQSHTPLGQEKLPRWTGRNEGAARWFASIVTIVVRLRLGCTTLHRHNAQPMAIVYVSYRKSEQVFVGDVLSRLEPEH